MQRGLTQFKAGNIQAGGESGLQGILAGRAFGQGGGEPAGAVVVINGEAVSQMRSSMFSRLCAVLSVAVLRLQRHRQKMRFVNLVLRWRR